MVVRSPLLDAGGNRIVDRFDPIRDAGKIQSRLRLHGAGGYTGARTDRAGLKEWNPRTGSADEDTIPALQRLRARSRDLARNNPTARSAIGVEVRNAVGSGLTPIPQPDAKYLELSDEEAGVWAERAERIWWACAGTTRLDIRRSIRFSTLTQLVLRSRLESGDILVLRRFRRDPGDLLGLKLQLIEADRISTPPTRQSDDSIVEGVEFNRDGVPIAYHVSDHHPGDPYGLERKWRRVEAFNAAGHPQALHLYDLERPGQTRGVPMLAPVIESLKQLGRYSNSELMAAVVGGMVVFSLQTESGEERPTYVDDGSPGEKEASSDEDSDLEIDYGALLGLADGEELEMHAPNRPNAAFGDFVTAMQKEIGAALGIPYEVMLAHFSRSYSASRAAWMLAWKHFWMVRDQIAWDFCHQVYGWCIEEAVARGLIEAPGFFDDPLAREAWLAAEWRGAPPGQLDPLKEIQAIEKRRKLKISTLAQDTAEVTGGDWRANLQQLAVERREKASHGLPLEDGDGAEPVPVGSDDTFDGEGDE